MAMSLRFSIHQGKGCLRGFRGGAGESPTPLAKIRVAASRRDAEDFSEVRYREGLKRFVETLDLGAGLHEGACVDALRLFGGGSGGIDDADTVGLSLSLHTKLRMRYNRYILV